MNAFDIFQKLLPFTTKQGDETVWAFLSLQPTDLIITIFILFLIGFSLWQWLKLRDTSKEDNKILQDLIKVFDRTSNDEPVDLSHLDQEIENLKETRDLSSIWKSYKQTLIRSENEFTGVQDIFSTVDSSYFFNSKTLLTRIKTKSVQTVPSILLGIGLIGTFLGLFYGLVPLNLEDSSVVQQSMNELIRAAGAKFASSIWGLGLSVFFTFLLKRYETQFEKQISTLQNKINDYFEQQNSEKLLFDLKNGVSLQEETLNNLSLNIAEQLKGTISDSLIETIKTPLENLAQNIGGSPENTLYSRLDVLSGGLGSDFSNNLKTIMNEMLSEIRHSVGNDADNMKQTLSSLTTLLTSLKDTFEQQQQNSQQATKETFDALSTALNDIRGTVATQSNQLEQVLGGLSQQISVLVTKVEEQGNSLNQGADKIAKISSEAAQNINTQSLSVIEDAFGGMKSVLKETFEQQQQNSQQAMKETSNALSIVLNDIHNTVARQNTQLEQVLGGLSQQISVLVTKVEEQGNSLNQGAEKIAKTSSEAAQNINTQSLALLENIENAFGGIKSIMENTKNKLSVIPQYLEQFNSSTKQLTETSQNALLSTEKLYSASTELTKNRTDWQTMVTSANVQLENAFKTLSNTLTENANKLGLLPDKLSNIVNRIDQLGEHTRSICDQLATTYSSLLDQNSESIQRFSEQVSLYESQTANSVKDYQQQATKYIGETFGQFDKGLKDFAENLASAVTELNDAISDLSDTTRR